MISFKRVANGLWSELNIIAIQISLFNACCLFKNKMLPLRKINDSGLTLLSRNYTCYVNLANYKCCLNSFGCYNRQKRPFIRGSTWCLYLHNKTEIIKNDLRKEEMLMRNECTQEWIMSGDTMEGDQHRGLRLGHPFPSASLRSPSSPSCFSQSLPCRLSPACPCLAVVNV